MIFLETITSMVSSFGVWTTANADMLGMAIAAMGGVSSTLEPIKKLLRLSDTTVADHFKLLGKIWLIRYFARKISVVDLLHYAFAVVVVGIHYIQGSHSNNPVIVLGQAFIIMGGNRFIYPAFVQPVSQMFTDAKAIANVKHAKQQAEQIVNTFQG